MFTVPVLYCMWKEISMDIKKIIPSKN